MSAPAGPTEVLLDSLPADGEALTRRCGAYADAMQRLGRRRGVSIIIPIYNAPDALDRCLGALEDHAAEAEIVLVDDHSSDSRVAALTSDAAKRPRTTVVRSDRNAGFVRSCNAGMLAADGDNDIVLLNSDTEVTPGWLRKLATAALSRPNVATVSPLSNAAGIFSVPRPHADAPPPAGWTPDMCARALEDVSERLYEEVPATSGFCLYLRREALDRIGMFDDLLVRRGYGEENDFCARASQAGMTHVVDDATFVFHRRAESFHGWKGHLKAQNSRVLKELHPGHLDDQRRWEAASELGTVRRRYGAFVKAIGTPPHGDRRTWVEPLRTRLLLGRDTVEASWREGERTVAVSVADGGVEVGIFGARRFRARCMPDERLALAAWLGNRFVVSEVESAGFLSPGEERVLRSALSLD